jgi:hypothetical protein
MMYGFNGRRIDYWLPGHTEDSLAVPRKIYWDAAAKMFVGPSTQAFRNERLYRVVREQSSRFQPFEPVADEMIVAGGRTENVQDYHWDIIIPEGQKAKLHCLHEYDAAATAPSKTLQTFQLSEGLQIVQVLVRNAEEDANSSELTVYVNQGGKREAKKVLVPRIPDSDSASMDDWKVVRSSDGQIDLLYFALNRGKEVLRFRLELQ